MLENISNDDFPFKDLYVIGFYLSSISIFSYSAEKAAKLSEEASLLYGEKYKHYYANLIWAQILSFAVLFIDLFFILASFLYDTSNMILAFFVLLIGIVIDVYFYSSMGLKLQKRSEECMSNFPDIISKLALLVSSGMILREAWNLVANSSDGELYKLMKDSCTDMENGKSEVEALYKFGVTSNLQEVRKFSSSLIQSLEKGSADLVHFLVTQSTELWETKKQVMLQKGEVAASKLLGPIALMFVGVIIIIATAAFAGLSF